MNNEDIAKKVGWEYATTKSPKRELWRTPDGIVFNNKLPDFLNSMDACEKWVIPWLREKGDIEIGFYVREDGYSCQVAIWIADEPIENSLGKGPTMSSALCNAVENME